MKFLISLILLVSAQSTFAAADKIAIKAHGLKIDVSAVTDSVLRVQIATLKGNFAHDSWAVVPLPVPKTTQVKSVKGAIELSVGGGKISVDKRTGRMRFFGADGVLLTEDARPATFTGSAFSLTRNLLEGEHFFGLGDKAGPMDHRGQSFVNWNTDAYEWGETTDPLYKTIPFFISLHHGHTYGTFLDNTWRSVFDFGKESHDTYKFGADGGALDYYFIFGKEPKDVVVHYTELTGRIPLPPLWSLGYQQSRYSYGTEKRVREIADNFRDRKIPADVIYLDIDYQDGNRPFTVNQKAFPHFEKMLADLAEQNFSVIAITDLHLKKEKGYKPYDEGMAGDYFVKSQDGSVYEGVVWPGPSVFPEFTLGKVRDWWGTLYHDFVAKGVRGFWNDMNEPAIFERADKTMPLTNVHRLEGDRKTTHKEIHNVFGQLNSRATYEGLLKLQPNERPFVLTRATYSGGQKYAATWTGDNSSTWPHMRLMLPTLMNLGVSGFALVGADIGGFVGNPTQELLTRWLSLGAFTPIDRDHTMKDSKDQEPWVGDSDQVRIRKHFIEMRYQLMPYLYTLADEASRTGVPMMRPLYLEFPLADKLTAVDQEFMLGSALLIAPQLAEAGGAYAVDLPPGVWYDFVTGKQVKGEHLEVHPKLSELPMYVREGSIIPQQAIVQSTKETPDGPLEIQVYPGINCRGEAYFDDGHSFNYKKADWLRLHMGCEKNDAGSVRFMLAEDDGDYKPWFKKIAVRFFGISAKPGRVLVNEQMSSDWKYDSDAQALKIDFPHSGKSTIIVIEP